MNQNQTVWATQVLVDLNGNVIFNLPPTEGKIISDCGTDYFVALNETNPLKRYQVGSTVFILDSREGAENIYRQKLDAFIETALHLIRQISYLEAKLDANS